MRFDSFFSLLLVWFFADSSKSSVADLPVLLILVVGILFFLLLFLTIAILYKRHNDRLDRLKQTRSGATPLGRAGSPSEPWFHGFMTDADADDRLLGAADLCEGMYFVYEPEIASKDLAKFIIIVYHDGAPHRAEVVHNFATFEVLVNGVRAYVTGITSVVSCLQHDLSWRVPTLLRYVLVNPDMPARKMSARNSPSVVHRGSASPSNARPARQLALHGSAASESADTESSAKITLRPQEAVESTDDLDDGADAESQNPPSPAVAARAVQFQTNTNRQRLIALPSLKDQPGRTHLTVRQEDSAQSETC